MSDPDTSGQGAKNPITSEPDDPGPGNPDRPAGRAEKSSAADDNARLRYRLLTGQDTSEFCQRVSDAMAAGYQLYGSPTLIFDPDQGTRVAAQAVVLPD